MDSYKKVNKPTARKMYNSGLSVFLLPCKCRFPDSDSQFSWVLPIEINMFTTEESENKFDRSVNSFEYYNCNAELGYYASYYVTEQDYSSYKMCDLVCN